MGAVGTPLTLSAQATGGQLSYQWLRNGLDIGSATSAQYSFTPSLADDGATYAIRVWNSAGQTLSTNVELTLQSTGAGTLLGLAGRMGGTGRLDGPGTDNRLALKTFQPQADGSLWIQELTRDSTSSSGWSRWSSTGQRNAVTIGGLVGFRGLTQLPLAQIELQVYRWNGNALGAYLLGPSSSNIFDIHRLIDGDRDTQADVGAVSSPILRDDGTLYFVDAPNLAVRSLTPQNKVVTLSRLPSSLTSLMSFQLAVLADGRYLLLAQDNNSKTSTLWRLEWVTTGTPRWVWTQLPPTNLHTALLSDRTGSKIYSAQGNALVQVTAEGSVTVLAGSVAASADRQDGPAASARLALWGDSVTTTPELRLDLDGNVWMMEDSTTLRQLDISRRVVRTVLGRNDQSGLVDGLGSEARFRNKDILSWAADTSGNLYLIDSPSQSLRRVSPTGQTSTLLSNFPTGGGLAVGPDGSYYAVRGHAIIKVSPTGQQSVLAGRIDQPGYADGPGSSALFYDPESLAWDAQGRLLVAEAWNTTYTNGQLVGTQGGSVRRVTLDGIVSTFADPPWSGQVVASDYQNARLMAPGWMVCNALGQIAIADIYFVRRQIRIYDNNGQLLRILTLPRFTDDIYFFLDSWISTRSLHRIAWADNTSLLWGEGNLIQRIDMAGQTQTVAGTPGQWGVRRGALPGCLNDVAGLLGNPAKPKSYFVLSENSVLQMTL